MALPGPEQSGAKLGRTPNADWTEVPNEVPKGKPPVTLTAASIGSTPSPMLVAWWKTVVRMPHVVLWTEADWQYALDTAVLKQEWYRKPATANLATEIRRREDSMGTTLEARRKLRIRYVTPSKTKTEASGTRSKKATVASLDDRRRRRSAGNAP